MPQMLTFRVDGEPVAQPRHRIASRGRFATAYIPKSHAIHGWKWAIEEAAREKAERIGWVPLRGQAVSMMMIFTFARPRSNKTERHTQRPDLDNLAKAVLDALNGIVFVDDSAVDKMLLRKLWRPSPGVLVVVTR